MKSPKELNTSSQQFYEALLVEGTFTKEKVAMNDTSFIDPRDVAQAHVRAFEREAAGGERFIIRSGAYQLTLFSSSSKWSCLSELL